MKGVNVLKRKSIFAVVLSTILVVTLAAPIAANAASYTAAFFRHGNGEGASSWKTSTGDFDMNAMGIENDSISSIYVYSGFEVVAYEHSGFRGSQRVYGAGWHNMTDDGFNDIISSFTIRNAGGGGNGGGNGYTAPSSPATFYEHIDCRGAYTVKSEGRYDLNQMGLSNDSISCIYVGSGYTVEAYEHSGFSGRCVTLGNGTHNMTDYGFNDAISSYIVYNNDNGGGGGGGGGSPRDYASWVDLSGNNRALVFSFGANATGSYELEVKRDGQYLTTLYTYANAGSTGYFSPFDPGYDHGYWNPISGEWEDWAHQNGNRLTLTLYYTGNGRTFVFSAGDWWLLDWGTVGV